MHERVAHHTHVFNGHGIQEDKVRKFIVDYPSCGIHHRIPRLLLGRIISTSSSTRRRGIVSTFSSSPTHDDECKIFFCIFLFRFFAFFAFFIEGKEQRWFYVRGRGKDPWFYSSSPPYVQFLKQKIFFWKTTIKLSSDHDENVGTAAGAAAPRVR